MRDLGHNIRFALRMTRKNPGYTMLVVLTLALGLGSGAAIFSVVNAVLLRPLPYADPERLVLVRTKVKEGDSLWSGPGVVDFIEQTRSYQGVARFAGSFQLFLPSEEGPVAAATRSAWPELLPVLGVSPILGRQLSDDDYRPLSAAMRNDPSIPRPTQPVLVSHSLFQRAFGSDPRAVGTTFRVQGQPQDYELAGVLPPGFRIFLPQDLGGTSSPDILRPSGWDLKLFPRKTRYIWVIARLRPGVSIEQAQAEAGQFAQRQREQHQSEKEDGFQVRIVPLHQDVVGAAFRPIWILFGAVGLVLLISCANVANLVLARSTVRQREWAVRLALGAGRKRVMGQMLTEGLLFSGLAGAAGLLLANWGLGVLAAMRPANLPRVEDVSLDASVLAFTLLTTLLTTLAFTIGPAMVHSRPDFAGRLKDGAMSSSGIAHQRMRWGLATGEVALALVLFISSGLLLRSFAALLWADLGFDPKNVLTAGITPARQAYSDQGKRLELYKRLQESISSLPGVESAGFASPLPLAGNESLLIWSEDRSTGEVRQHSVDFRRVTPGYFQAVGTRLLRGRLLNWDDLKDFNRLAALADEKLANKLWPGEDPIGRQLQVSRLVFGGEEQVQGVRDPVEIVGIVETIRGRDPGREDRESIYLSYQYNAYGSAGLVVRAHADPLSLTEPVKRTLAGLDKSVPLLNVRPMEDYVRDAVAPVRFITVLIGVFGAIALVLAIVGVYGVISYSVSQRAREIGLRMTLGAQQQDILRMVLGKGAACAASGLVLGLALSLAATRLLSNQLVGIAADDGATYAAVSALLFLVALAACWLPARRATEVDPLAALRSE